MFLKAFKLSDKKIPVIRSEVEQSMNCCGATKVSEMGKSVSNLHPETGPQ